MPAQAGRRSRVRSDIHGEQAAPKVTARGGFMINPLIRKLENVAVLTGEQRDLLERLCDKPRAVPAHRDILRQGERPNHLHLIIEGWAMRYNVLPDGSRQITAFLLPGDFCDLQVMVLDQMDHSIATLCPTRVAYLPLETARELAGQRPELVQALWWATLVDESVLRAWIVNLGRRDAEQRTAHMLCELYQRMDNVGLVSGKTFDLPLTREEIADSLGVTPTHLHRVMKNLTAHGLIAFRNKRLSVPDIEQLKHAAGFDPAYLHPEHVRVN
jgi:CRP-like cAMP-binding protein